MFLVIQVIDQLLSLRVSLVPLATQIWQRTAIASAESGTDTFFIVVAIVMAIAALARIRPLWLHGVLMAYLTVAMFNLALNIFTLVVTTQFASAEQLTLLWDVALVYANTVMVFAVWYRLLNSWLANRAFEFPADPHRPDCQPGWVDYLFISFNTNATFGPTAEIVHSRIAKVLMMAQTCMSLVILVVLVARIVGLRN